MDFALALDGHFQPRGKRVGHRYAHAVQTAGKSIRAAVFFVELAARVQLGEYQLDHRNAFERMQPHGNAAAVVAHGKRAVVVDVYVDGVGITAERFVGGIVDDFLADVGRAFGTGVHARAFFNRFETFENGDAGFAVLVGCGHEWDCLTVAVWAGF